MKGKQFGVGMMNDFKLKEVTFRQCYATLEAFFGMQLYFDPITGRSTETEIKFLSITQASSDILIFDGDNQYK
jgi:hypothetical protein